MRAGREGIGGGYEPDEVFVLPGGTDASDLENKDTVVVQEVVDLPEEGAIAADTDVLKPYFITDST